jgi:hypothetical protein
VIEQSRILNNQALTSIFGKIPCFKGSELLDIKLKRDGASQQWRV